MLAAEPGKATHAQWSPAPPCQIHVGSKVIRNGTYGKGLAVRRQKYKCFPPDGSRPHEFTPPLPRDHVHENDEHCDHCDELRGIHRGETAVARRHSWSTRIVARGLEQLANGASYASVSQWAIRVSGTTRTRRSADGDEPFADEEGLDGATDTSAAPDAGEPETAEVDDGGDGEETVDQDDTPKKRRTASAASKASRNAWHIAADWVEAFSRVIYEPVEEQLRAEAIAERERLDELVETGAALDRPRVILVDDVPVYGRDLDRKTRTRRDAGYFVLVVAELHWPEATRKRGRSADPTIRLRLVRAMAKSNTASWRIVFDELGYHPDFVVADAGTGIAGAIEQHFDAARTKLIPSLWHLTQKVELSLADTPGAATIGPGGKELIPPLRDHVRLLSRHSSVLDSVENWTGWWEGLLSVLTTHRLATDEVRRKRKHYEPAMAAVIDDIATHPQIPVSTGGLETLIAKQVKPLLALRRTSFGNIERTNRLFDLVVAKDHGAFDNLGEVAKLLRLDAEQHDGWTVPLRAVADPRPIGGTYSSLRDTTLLNTIAKQRGVAR